MWIANVSWQYNRYRSGQMRLVGFIIDDVIKALTILKVKVIDYDIRYIVMTTMQPHIKSPMVVNWMYVVTYDDGIMLQLTFDDNNKANVSFRYHTQKDVVDTLTLDQVTF